VKKKEALLGLDLELWRKAAKLVNEGNVKLHDPNSAITQFKVIGDSDAYTVGVDIDTGKPKCQCEDEFYRDGVCKHEVAVHLVLIGLGADGEDSPILESVLEKPELFVREKRL